MLKRSGLSLLCLLCLASFSLGSGQAAQQLEVNRESPPTGGRPFNAIVVTPSSRTVAESEAPRGMADPPKPGIRPIRKYAEFSVNVQSGLPKWGVVIEALGLAGPEGEVPLDRLQVKTDLTGGEFKSMAGPAPVITGDFRLPACDSKIMISFVPSWEDPAGPYTGRLVLRPYVPEDQDISLLSPGNHLGLIANDQEVQLSFNNNETIMIDQPQNEIEFELHSTSSGREAVAEVTFMVSTNARRWRVACEATFLEGGKHQIPASRIEWKRLNEYGQAVDSGNMSDDIIVLEGLGPAQNLSSKLELTLPLSPSDLAGSYVGQLTFIGVVEGSGEKRVDEKEIITPTSGE
jgi:hypothetical protein